MTSVWTHGTWTVKPGRENEFVAEWRAMVDDVSHEIAGVQPPTLLRDHDQPNVFVSFGPWNDLDTIARFRASDAFRRHVTAMGDLLDSFEAKTLDEVSRGG